MNILKAIGAGALDSIKSPMKVVKDIGKGKFSDAWADLKHIPGNQERANKDIFQSAGIRGWVGDHPGESVGALLAAIYGGAAAAGAMGGTAGGTAGTAAGAAGGTAGSAAGGAAGSAGGAAGGAGGGGLSSMWGSFTNYLSPSNWGSVSDADLGSLADAESGGAVQANLGTGSEALSKVGSGSSMDTLESLGRVFQSVGSSSRGSQAPTAGGSSRPSGFNYDSKLYQNPLLNKEYSQLYNQPLYNNNLIPR